MLFSIADLTFSAYQSGYLFASCSSHAWEVPMNLLFRLRADPEGPFRQTPLKPGVNAARCCCLSPLRLLGGQPRPRSRQHEAPAPLPTDSNGKSVIQVDRRYQQIKPTRFRSPSRARSQDAPGTDSADAGGAGVCHAAVSARPQGADAAGQRQARAGRGAVSRPWLPAKGCPPSPATGWC
jgi:hypothetical protein